jgi:hypothetical protein
MSAYPQFSQILDELFSDADGEQSPAACVQDGTHDAASPFLGHKEASYQQETVNKGAKDNRAVSDVEDELQSRSVPRMRADRKDRIRAKNRVAQARYRARMRVLLPCIAHQYTILTYRSSKASLFPCGVPGMHLQAMR